MAHTIRRLSWSLIVAAAALTACGSTDLVDVGTASTEGTNPEPECHFPTTVPGGELPQPQCETPPEDTTPTSSTVPPSPWECPADDDYPIYIAATSWQPFTDQPEAIEACSGLLSESGSPTLLVPTEPIARLDPQASLGLNVIRQPGGLWWHGRVAIPAARSPEEPTVELAVTRIGDGYPEEERLRWVDDFLFRACSLDTNDGAATETTVQIRGTEGCATDTLFAWVDGFTGYVLTVAADLESDQTLVIDWIDEWATAN